MELLGQDFYGMRQWLVTANIANHGGRLYVNYVQEIDPKELPDVDCVIATPSCKNASIASGVRETQEDVEVGRAIAQFIKTTYIARCYQMYGEIG